MTCKCNFCKARRGEITPQAYKKYLEKVMETYEECDKDFAKQCIEQINKGTFLENF